MQSVLVTGGAGFLGSHLSETLITRGCAVTVLDTFADAPRHNLRAVEGRYTLVEGDVRDPGVFQHIGHVDTIFHLAANANVPLSSKNPLHDGSVNILGTINALELARARKATFYLASSGAVYGEPIAPPMAEDHQIAPVSPYGASKLAAEQYVELYKRLYGIDATIVRFFNMYGPRQRRFVVFDFARKILEADDEVVVLGDGRQIRSQLFVLDAVAALLAVAEHGTEPIYNVGSASSFTVTELLHVMMDVLGSTKRLRMSNASWDGDIQRLVPDAGKLHGLGFREQWPLRAGLHAFKDWFLAEYAEQYAHKELV